MYQNVIQIRPGTKYIDSKGQVERVSDCVEVWAAGVGGGGGVVQPRV